MKEGLYRARVEEKTLGISCGGPGERWKTKVVAVKMLSMVGFRTYFVGTAA